MHANTHSKPLKAPSHVPSEQAPSSSLQNSTHYDFKVEELQLRAYWETEGVYRFDSHSKKPIFSVDTPPPTVSGKMHIGHAFSYAQQDFIVRYKRMRGFNVFYPFGTDDNGLATERMIESMKNVRSKKMQRRDFIKLCLDTLSEIRPAFVDDWKRIGCSCDFSLFYSTIDKHCQGISQRSFLELYKMGRIYQKKAPIIFCPHCKTAIAQVEMEDVEKTTTLNYVKAKVESGEYIIYATTRPELHPACMGISLNESGDYVTCERDTGEHWIISKDAVEKLSKDFPMRIVKTYKGKQLVGKKVTIPFAQKPVVISHDISAKTEYGTGVVYYCSYGGLDCVEWLARHPEATPLHVMDETGVYNDLSPYKGMNSLDARKQILIDLEAQGSLLKKEQLVHAVNTHERCGTDIEYIATKQWFVSYLDLKEQFLDAGKQMRWYPEHMRVRYDNWIHGLKWDWCISRQRYFGVPFPLWYCRACHTVMLADEKKLPVDPLVDHPTKSCSCGSKEFVPEPDVLDTWATSSLTPQLAIELFKDHPSYATLSAKLYPMSLRPQAHDIITFWLFNTVVKSRLHHEINPWQNIMIAGHALDPHGKKMSKSKGNVVSPQDVIAKYGADALRFWAAGSKLGDDLPYQEKDLVTAHKMVTKLWNASKFAMMHLSDYDPAYLEGKGDKKSTGTDCMLDSLTFAKLEPLDQWMLAKLHQLIASCTDSFEEYEYAKTKTQVEYFFWHTFCDYYLELVKDRLYNAEVRGTQARLSAQYTLYHSLLTCLKLLAPLMPYITDAVYQQSYAAHEGHASIHVSSWPTAHLSYVHNDALALGDCVVSVISAVRKQKSDAKVSLKTEVKQLVITCAAAAQSYLVKAKADLQATTNAKDIVFTLGKELSVVCEF